MTRVLAILAFLTLLFANPIHAATPVDQAGADALKQSIIATLDDFEKTYKGAGLVFKRAGDVTVTPNSTYYTATTPSLALVTAKGETLTLGVIAINAVPTDDPNVLSMAMAIPPTITKTDAAGKIITITTIGQQTQKGLWQLKEKFYSSVKASYQTIVSKDLVKNAEVTIASISIDTNMQKDAAGLWSGPSNVILSDLQVKGAEPSTVSIKSIDLQSSFAGIDLVSARQMWMDIISPTGNDSLTGIFSAYADKKDGQQQSVFNVKDVTISGLDKKTKAPWSGGLKSMVFAFGSSQNPDKTENTSWNFTLDGLTSSTPASAPFLPSHIGFKGAVKNIPVASILNVTNTQTNKTPADKAAAQAAWMNLLKNSTVTLTIDELASVAPKYSLNAKSAFQASKTSPYGVTGSLFLALRGLEDLIAWAAQPDAPKRKDGTPAIPAGPLSMLSALGQQGTDAAGQPIRTYDLKLSPDGKLTLNGADLSAMFQANKAAATTAAPPATVAH
jgi:hypothetical protein